MQRKTLLDLHTFNGRYGRALLVSDLRVQASAEVPPNKWLLVEAVLPSQFLHSLCDRCSRVCYQTTVAVLRKKWEFWRTCNAFR